ncbi:MAG: DUF2238 domain-containing protein [Nanoarchaeota archaeon]|nr:DUF2238 domain-containing protein [Nanoarchaeota archaeon]
MKGETELKLMLYFTVGYLLFFTIISVLKQNYEFLYYAMIMTVLILIAIFYHKKLHLPNYILGGLSLVGVLHLMGGFLFIGSTRLYDFWLIPGIFKYDNLVHLVGIFVVTILAYNLLYPHLDKKIKHNKFLLSLLLVLIALGVGAFNEILELVVVVFLPAAHGIGGYFNNVLDLLFGLLGSIFAALLIVYWKKK